MDDTQRPAVVSLGLDEATMTRARTRFVKPQPLPEPPRPPELGDPWCPLTVRARLQRMAEVYRRMPHTPDTRPGGYRSCMPDPVREIFKDQPSEARPVPVGREDRAAADQTLDSFITLTRLNKIVGWHIANNLGDRRLGRYIRHDGKTAAKLKQKLLAFLANDWNERGWSPDIADITLARDSIHRKI